MYSVVKKQVLSAVCAAAFAGCAAAGIVVIDLSLDVQVSGSNASGQRWQSSAANFSREPVVPNASSLFPATVYNGAAFSWRFYAAPDSIGVAIRSNATTSVCFRFDEARIASNIHPLPIPLVVNWLTIDGKPNWDGVTSEAAKRSMTKRCFGSTYTRIAFGPDPTELFKSGALFDATLDASKQRLASSGRGNSITLFVPIEHSGIREDVEIKLTVADSATRISNFLR